MKITQQSLLHSNIVFVLGSQNIPRLLPQQVFSLIPAEAQRGSTFVDDPAMELQIFNFPQVKQRLILEQRRLRLEDSGQSSVEDSQLPNRAFTMLKGLFPQMPLEAYGFNFDVILRTAEVIPQRDIMQKFVAEDKLEDVRDFGWQYTRQSPTSTATSTVMFKVVSPLELAVHVNFNIPTQTVTLEQLQKDYTKHYVYLTTLTEEMAF